MMFRESLSHIEFNYHPIDDKIINGEQYTLYEHNIYGDRYEYVIVNKTRLLYGYTVNSIETLVKYNSCYWFRLQNSILKESKT